MTALDRTLVGIGRPRGPIRPGAGRGQRIGPRRRADRGSTTDDRRRGSGPRVRCPTSAGCASRAGCACERAVGSPRPVRQLVPLEPGSRQQLVRGAVALGGIVVDGRRAARRSGHVPPAWCPARSTGRTRSRGRRRLADRRSTVSDPVLVPLPGGAVDQVEAHVRRSPPTVRARRPLERPVGVMGAVEQRPAPCRRTLWRPNETRVTPQLAARLPAAPARRPSGFDSMLTSTRSATSKPVPHGAQQSGHLRRARASSACRPPGRCSSAAGGRGRRAPRRRSSSSAATPSEEAPATAGSSRSPTAHRGEGAVAAATCAERHVQVDADRGRGGEVGGRAARHRGLRGALHLRSLTPPSAPRYRLGGGPGRRYPLAP